MPFPHRAALRASGAAIGAFILVNLAGEALRPSFETLAEWITLPGDARLRGLLAAVVANALLANAAMLRRPPRLRRVGAVLFAVVAILALGDVAGFYAALARGDIHTPSLLPASLFVAAFFAALGIELCAAEPRVALPRRPLVAGAAVLATLLALPLLRITTFGPTHYDRPADCAVVFGARVWNDGTPSHALADRVDEAIHLYQRGLVKRIVMSGGVEPENGLSEAVVMGARAEAAGIPHDALLLDVLGVDTAATVRNTAALMEREDLRSALVVSHYYHEPRAKMLFDRAGVQTYTVPATMTRRLYREPYFLAREVAAFWRSFLLD